MLNDDELDELLALLEGEAIEDAADSQLSFMRYMWQKTDEPFLVGHHTAAIAHEIDEAIKAFRAGRSTFLVITVPYRHGKSDIVSRYLPPRFLALFPDCEVMLVTYAAKLAAKFSRFGRNLVRTEKFARFAAGLGKALTLSRDSGAADRWSFAGTIGGMSASGILSGLTGSGYHLGIMDDFVAGRADAESPTIREKLWEAFSDDFMTRRAPVSITIVLATSWHQDDIIGRIKRKVAEDPAFPRFKVLAFPARSEEYLKLKRARKSRYLFPERFSDEWYKEQYATLGAYSAAALLDCDPVKRSGSMLAVDGIEVVDELPDDLRLVRVWDLAHTRKQRAKDDPDWTSGTLHCFRFEGDDPVPYLYVADVKRTRAGAVERDNAIRATVFGDGVFVKQYVETSLDSKDAYDYLTTTLKEFSFSEVKLKGDKVTRATPLEPIFAAPGHVKILRGDWNDEWVAELLSFDGTETTHDDQVDNLSSGYLVQIASGKLIDENSAAIMARRRRS